MNPSVRRREYQSRHDRWTDPRRDFATTLRDLGQRAFRTVLAVFARLQTAAARLVRAHPFRDKFNAIALRIKLNAISLRGKLNAISFKNKFNAIRFRDKLDTISFRDKPNAIAERLSSRTEARAARVPDISRARGLSRDDDVLRLAGRTEQP